MSAEETVFSIPELRLYILQYSIEDHKMERSEGCVKKCRKKINHTLESCLFNIVCCCLCCFSYRPNIGILFR